MDQVTAAAERAARESYGRLLALTAARSGDITSAEDALADAFAAALATWPDRGVPANPDAWLLTTARNAASNARRSSQAQVHALDELDRRETERRQTGDFPDERLKLLFVCAHPAIDPTIRTPLMLQTVLGLDAARIASAFATRPATMGQRLVRAKAKIKDAGIRFETPGSDSLPERLSDVLDAIYGAYGTGWDALPGADADLTGFAEEAIYLGRLVAALMPREPEAKGLLALMLYCEARRGARFTSEGAFVPLAEQDSRLWDGMMVAEAERLLTDASLSRRFGRYQCEAAIQSVHAQRAITGRQNHDALATLYELLVTASPSLGALVARAAARRDAGHPSEALDMLDAIEGPAKEEHQAFWVVRAACLDDIGRNGEGNVARQRAIGLSEHPAIRRFLLSKQRDRPEPNDPVPARADVSGS